MELYSSLFYFMYAVVRPNKINVLFHCNSTVRANNVPTVTNFINILKKKKEKKSVKNSMLAENPANIISRAP